MSDSINVRVTLGSYDLVHPSEKQTQVYVQIPEVGRASWLLDAASYAVLKDEPWPHVIDSAHEAYERRGVVSDSTSTAAREAVVDWLLRSEGADYDERYDAVQAAWELDAARRHPVARKLLEKNEQLTARVAELESERHSTNESLDDAAKALRANRDRIAELDALVGAVTECRVWEPGYGLYVRRSPGATGFAILEARRTSHGRRAWTVSGLRYSAVLSDEELFCWPDAESAVAEARRVMPGAVVRGDVAPSVEESADGLTALLAPSQVLREDADACCHLHKSAGCCDPEDCGPCCMDCPTCPVLAKQRAL